MPISGRRALGLQRRKHRLVQNFYKTVHLELVVPGTTSSAYRSSADEPTVTFSILLDPRPIVRIAAEEDIAETGMNVSLQDLIFEIIGDQVSEANLRSANRIVLNKDEDDEEHLSIQQIRPGDWAEQTSAVRNVAVISGQVIKWKIFARSTKRAA